MVTKDRRVAITLPPEVPEGPADVVVVVSPLGRDDAPGDQGERHESGDPASIFPLFDGGGLTCPRLTREEIYGE
jgi:hypothetical protein